MRPSFPRWNTLRRVRPWTRPRKRGKGFKVDDLLNEVEKILSLTKQDQQDRHERRERRDGEDRPGAAE